MGGVGAGLESGAPSKEGEEEDASCQLVGWCSGTKQEPAGQHWLARLEGQVYCGSKVVNKTELPA